MFDTALLESRRDRKGRGKGAGLPLAIGLHVAVIGAFVGASVWSVGEPPEPVIPVTFFAPPAAPPPPRGDGGHVRESDARSAGTSIHVAGHRAAGRPAARDDDLHAGRPGLPGSGNRRHAGRSERRRRGDRRHARGPDGTGWRAPHVVGGDVRAPVLLSQLEPDYPEAARRAHKDGVVILEAVITADGAVDDVRILRSANPLLDAAAERAVRQWRYKPATLNGRAVSVYLTVTVTFGLRS